MSPENATKTDEAGEKHTGSQLPILPPNVSIFSPPSPVVTHALFQGRIFTRLTLSASTNANTKESVAETLQARSELEDQTFWLIHREAVVLVFDSSSSSSSSSSNNNHNHSHSHNDDDKDEEDEDFETVKDRHHEHVRSICLALKDGDVSLSISGCVFDAVDAVGAGFQFDRLSGGAVLVVDLMDGGDDDDEDDDDEEEEDDDDEDFDLLAGAEEVVA